MSTPAQCDFAFISAIYDNFITNESWLMEIRNYVNQEMPINPEFDVAKFFDSRDFAIGQLEVLCLNSQFADYMQEIEDAKDMMLEAAHEFENQLPEELPNLFEIVPVTEIGDEKFNQPNKFLGHKNKYDKGQHGKKDSNGKKCHRSWSYNKDGKLQHQKKCQDGYGKHHEMRNGQMSTSLILGIVIGVVVLLALVAGIVYLWKKKQLSNCKIFPKIKNNSKGNPTNEAEKYKKYLAEQELEDKKFDYPVNVVVMNESGLPKYDDVHEE